MNAKNMPTYIAVTDRYTIIVAVGFDILQPIKSSLT